MDVQQGKKAKWWVFLLHVCCLSLDRMPCQKTEGAAPRQPRPLADHPPRAMQKTGE
jgi:hypothetical protein